MFVFATITPKKQFFENAKQAILGILDQTRDEPGCIQFELHENSEEGKLFLYEQWQDENALTLHYQQPYTAHVFEQYEQWLQIPVDVVKMDKC
ncbi:putative quinol monooxygenase [Glaciecola sp. 1036]|uniref:putative quinol monooxygenase n=1 Tax=Alteromonadaceae TaxID=72275 RepID=UPI003D069EDA